MKRKIYDELIKWKNVLNPKPLMLMGVRQCGKTYIIQEFCQNNYKKVIYVNLFSQDNIIDLYKSNFTSDEKFLQLKVLLDNELEDDDTCIFIDEIQESEELISELKYFNEEHPKMHIICAGSLLGLKLKRLKKSFPVGKVTMLNMYPMDFEEFLWAMGENNLIELLKKCYVENKAVSKPVHEKALNLYRVYLITGGMPESVQNMLDVNKDYIKYNTNIIPSIVEGYFNDMQKYVKNNAESLKISRIYDSLPNQLSNLSNKFQYSKIDSNARSRDYESSLGWLLASNLVLQSKAVKLPEVPLEGFVDMDVFKLYLSDIGILNYKLNISLSDILTDNISLYKGVIAENYVANQLVCKNYNLYYWRNDDYEVDFLLYTKDGIIPMEVKADKNVTSKSLNKYIELYKPRYAIRISTKNFGYDEKTKIKSIPIYAIFCIDDYVGR